jgi:hypothetical protein
LASSLGGRRYVAVAWHFAASASADCVKNLHLKSQGKIKPTSKGADVGVGHLITTRLELAAIGGWLRDQPLLGLKKKGH